MGSSAISDLRAKKVSQLIEELPSLRKDLLNIRFEVASGQAVDTSRSKKIRRNIARIKTVLSQSRSPV